MGSQRYLAEALMKHFVIPQDQAYQLARLIEDVQVGDDVSDAVYPIEQSGNVEAAISQLTSIHAQLGSRIIRLGVAAGKLEKR
jgi:hypothetical protein